MFKLDPRVRVLCCCFLACVFATSASAQNDSGVSIKDGWSDLIVSDIQVYEFALREKEDTGDETSLLSNNPAKRFVLFSPANADFFSHSQLPNALMSRREEVTVSKSGNRIIGNAGNRPVFRLAIEHNGDYSFRLFDTLDHQNDEGQAEAITLGFKLLGQNEDRRILGGAEIRVSVIDDTPQMNTTFCVFSDNYITTSQGAEISGKIGVHDASTLSFGADGKGYFHIANKPFSTWGFKGENGTMRVSGVPVQFETDSNRLVGRIGSMNILEFSIDKYSGKYKYRQFLKIDHQETNIGVPLVLNVPLHMHDNEGSYIEESITIDIYDGEIPGSTPL